MLVFAKWKGLWTRRVPFAAIFLSFFLIEVFAFLFLQPDVEIASRGQLWPLAFGGLWALILAGIVRLFTWKVGRIIYAVLFLLSFIYAVVQTGYYYMFHEMMWLSEFLYASEGTDYLDVVLSFPASWYGWIVALAALGSITVWKFPHWEKYSPACIISFTVCLACGMLAYHMPQKVFQQDAGVRYSGTDYGRAKSVQAAYEEMFNAHRLYEVCGLYHMAAKDIYTNVIYPLTPGYVTHQKQSWAEINSYFANDLDSSASNAIPAF